MSTVTKVPAGTRGFDCNAVVAARSAGTLFNLGYRFAVRYVGRERARTHDLSEHEASMLLNAGLGVMAVQHVESENSWIPSEQKGVKYGRNAGQFTHDARLLKGTMIWLDLEGVDSSVPDQQIIDYCNRWYEEVRKFEYTPGLYVGYAAGLSPRELYYSLMFSHYWGAYNLDRDKEPEVRGLQMKQYSVSANVSFPIDGNRVMLDAKGGLPLVCAPDEWAI